MHLTNEELSKIKKTYCESEGIDQFASIVGGATKSTKNNEFDEDQTIEKNSYILKYYEISVALGLHKDSYNLMRGNMSYGVPKHSTGLYSTIKKK